MVIYAKVSVGRYGVMFAVWRVVVGFIANSLRGAPLVRVNREWRFVRVWKFFVSEWIPPKG